jgi:outer membrane lipoprotein-sorting protein
MVHPKPKAARWSVPVALTALVAAAGAWGSASAAAEPSLPALSARDLLVKAQQVKVDAISGTVRSTTQLGFPALPSAMSADWSSLLSGTQTLRVYADGPQRQRVDLVGQLTQASVVHSGRDLWVWSSATRKVTHATLPDPAEVEKRIGQGLRDAPGSTPEQAPKTPQEAADRALAALTPTTTISVGRTAVVAGRPAYTLRLAPQEPTSLVGSVQVYVDADTGMALRTVVVPRGSAEPAVDIGFTSLRLSAPPARTFAFRAPTGTRVKQMSAPTARSVTPPRAQEGPRDLVREPGAEPQVLGKGWTAVAEMTGVPPLTGADMGAQVGALLRAATPVTGRFGTGRLLRTRLLTVLTTDDGRVFTGAVTADELLRQANLAGR